MVRDGLRTNAAGDGATRKLARLDRLIGLAVDGQGAGWLSTGPSAPLRNRMALPRWAIAGLKVVQTPHGEALSAWIERQDSVRRNDAVHLCAERDPCLP